MYHLFRSLNLLTLMLISSKWSLQETFITVLIPRQGLTDRNIVCFRNRSAQRTSKGRERVITFRVTIDNREKERRRVWFPCSSYLLIEIVLSPGHSSISHMLFPLIFASLVYYSAASNEFRPKVLVYSIQSGFSHVNFMGRVADTLAEGDMDVVSEWKVICHLEGHLFVIKLVSWDHRRVEIIPQCVTRPIKRSNDVSLCTK